MKKYHFKDTYCRLPECDIFLNGVEIEIELPSDISLANIEDYRILKEDAISPDFLSYMAAIGYPYIEGILDEDTNCCDIRINPASELELTLFSENGGLCLLELTTEPLA